MAKIGVIALSSPCRGDIFEDGLRYLEEKGFEVSVALDPVREYGKSTHLFSSDSASARAAALEELFVDPTVDFVISARGAYGSMEVLPHLDFDRLARFAKPMVGFSDTTAILLAAFRATGGVCYHGPSLSSLSGLVHEGQGRKGFEYLLEIMSGERKRPFDDLALSRAGAPGEVSGILWGGNLTLCAALAGTPWCEIPPNGVLFFEEVGVKPYALHRLLVQLELAGKFSELRAVIVGSLRGCEHDRGLGPSSQEVIESVFGNLGVPVFFGAPFGHEPHNCPVPIGVRAKISADNILELC